jgi:hypothetical protein
MSTGDRFFLTCCLIGQLGWVFWLNKKVDRLADRLSKLEKRAGVALKTPEREDGGARCDP